MGSGGFCWWWTQVIHLSELQWSSTHQYQYLVLCGVEYVRFTKQGLLPVSETILKTSNKQPLPVSTTGPEGQELH